MPAKKHIKYFGHTTCIDLQKSNRISQENIKNITVRQTTFAGHYLLPDINFNGHCLISNNISIPRKVIYIFLTY